jgi:uncharacterized lipoprotein
VKRFLTLLILALLTACAYSPQQITINPSVAVDTQAYGNGRGVSVSVIDARSTQVIGSRGGAYKNTSLITITNSITEAIAKAAQASLVTQGFNVNSSDAEVASLKISIEKLSYELPEQSVGKKVLLTAVLSLEASSGGKTYTGRYRTNSEKQTVVTPTMASNEKMINTLLSDTLERLFTDPKLKTFLSNI